MTKVIDLCDRSVVKHSGAIQVEGSIGLLARRSWNVLLAAAYDDLPDKDEFEIRVADLVKVLKFGSHNQEKLKKALGELVDATVEWNVLGKDRVDEWGKSALLAHVRVKRGVVMYSYSSFLRKMLHSPRMYARISLSLQNRFSSKYSLALYELLFDYFDTNRQMGETPWISLQRIRKLMGVEDGKHQEFKFFKRDVLMRAVDDVVKETDIEVDVLYKRAGRAVSEIKFCTKSKKGKRVKEAARLRVNKNMKKARLEIEAPRDRGIGIGW